jgi:hypothetical protein
VTERDLRLEDGRTLRACDSGGEHAADALTIVWHHGSPQTGAPLELVEGVAAVLLIAPTSHHRILFRCGSSRCYAGES